jgi:hypothetical protein
LQAPAIFAALQRCSSSLRTTSCGTFTPGEVEEKHVAIRRAPPSALISDVSDFASEQFAGPLGSAMLNETVSPFPGTGATTVDVLFPITRGCRSTHSSSSSQCSGTFFVDFV